MVVYDHVRIIMIVIIIYRVLRRRTVTGTPYSGRALLRKKKKKNVKTHRTMCVVRISEYRVKKKNHIRGTRVRKAPERVCDMHNTRTVHP